MAHLKTAAGADLPAEAHDALAAEAEKGYDLKRARKARVGRPGLGQAGVSPRVQVRVDPKLAKALRTRARKERRSVSEIARTALREYIDRP